jgi:hypothetical protein
MEWGRGSLWGGGRGEGSRGGQQTLVPLRPQAVPIEAVSTSGEVTPPPHTHTHTHTHTIQEPFTPNTVCVFGPKHT